MSPRPRLNPPEICPVCGEDVPRNAVACRECGADHNSGWRLEADLNDALGESADDFDYEEFVQEEFGRALKPRGLKTVWWLTAIVLLAALLYWLVR